MRIVVAMSGGVDSAVAALELKKSGHEVIGITIKTWPKEECGQSGEKLCCSIDAIQFARSAAEDMDIPHYVIDLSKEFAEEVTDYFVREYSCGRTPNPCIYCNSKIKFGYLFKKARELGAQMISTGHYARIVQKDGTHMLAEAVDEKQDQSYFLYDIRREMLPFIVFPLGAMSKKEVRQKAAKSGFMSAERSSSQDICFSSENGDYREYLAKSGLKVFSPGDILDVNGKVIGKHDGIASYTVGQRHGLGLGLHYQVYVTRIDPENNTVTVGQRDQAMHRKILVEGFNWLDRGALESPCRFDTRIRYNGKRSRATVTPRGMDEALVEFEEPQFAPTPGQAAVFYNGQILAGGAWIEEVIG
jgi:tRNA-uridine 2-sulfurtransferase